MVNVMFRVFRIESVNNLFVADCAQSRYRQNLSLTACEKSGTVSPGEQSDFATYRANFFQLSAVRTNFFVSYHFADDFFFDFVNDACNFFFGVGIFFRREFFGERGFNFFANFFDRRISCKFVRISYCLVNFFRRDFANRLINFFVRVEKFKFFFLFADFRGDFILELYKPFNFFVTEQNRFQNNFFRQFFRARLNHHHRVLRTGNHQVEFGNFCLFFRRIDYKFSVNSSDADTGNRTGKGNFRNAKRTGRTEHCRNFRRVVRVVTENSCDNLNVVSESVREERANRSVNQTTSQNSAGLRATFPFHESAGNFARRIHFFFAVNRQREKIYSFLRFCRNGRRHQYRSISVSNEHGTVCLFRHFSVFDNQFSSAEFNFKTIHIFSSSCFFP